MTIKKCPLCQQDHEEIQVQALYFAFINGDKTFFEKYDLDKNKVSLKRIAPPRKDAPPFLIRTSPDIIMMLILSIFLLVPVLFLDQLQLNQAVGIIGLFVIYLFFRNQLQTKYQTRLENYQKELDLFKFQTREWQKQTYCNINYQIVQNNK